MYPLIYSSLVKDYLDNERRGIAALPELIKDTQVVRFRGVCAANLQAVYLAQAGEPDNKGRDRGRGGRGGRAGGVKGTGTTTSATSPSEPYVSNTADIVCWTCHKRGHRSNKCTNAKSVHFASSVEEAQIFLSTIESFHPSQDQYPDEVIPDNNEITSILLSTANDLHSTIVMLDTESSIHLVLKPALLTTVTDSTSPVTVQGITGDKIKINLEGQIKDIGVPAYFNAHMAANLLSYHKLQEKHRIFYDEHQDTFSASRSWLDQF